MHIPTGMKNKGEKTSSQNPLTKFNVGNIGKLSENKWEILQLI